MAMELIKGERSIRALKRGAKRLNDGGGLYLLPFAGGGDSHYWRLDYIYDGKRKTLSLGVYPAVDLAMVRTLAVQARKTLASGVDPSQERKHQRVQIQKRNEADRLAKAGQPAIGSFEEVARRWFSVKSSQWVRSYSSKVIRRLELHGFPRLGRLPLAEITPKRVLDACRSCCS